MKKYFFTAIIILCILGIAGIIWVSIDFHRQLSRPMNLQSTETLRVRPGTSLTAIGQELVQRGWISHPHYFIYSGRSNGLAGMIKAGEYALQPGMTPEQVLSLIVSGKVIQYPLTIPEGWTYRQIMGAVRSHPHLVQTIPDVDEEIVMLALGMDGHSPEGRFFPDTYLFPDGTRDVDFLARAFRTMERVLNTEWQQRDLGLPYSDPYQALIMASIIEKETATADERYRIAGVFVRRLQRGMKLQTDPTVIYAAGPSFNGDITSRDLNLDSPYNTYLYAGLPPTPIAAPGRESIRAALHPADGKELYFVSMGDGRHYFSETLAEHNQAVTRYQLNRNK